MKINRRKIETFSFERRWHARYACCSIWPYTYIKIISNVLGISFVFPVAECDLSLTTQHKGVLSGISSIGIIVSSHFWGFLADQRGRKTVIVPTLILSFLATFMSSLATNFSMLVVYRFLSGFLWASVALFFLLFFLNGNFMFSICSLAPSFPTYPIIPHLHHYCHHI